jgi:hypothetical protein
MQWEERLLEEMYRLKSELEQMHLDDRNKELYQLRQEMLQETQELTVKYKQKEKELIDQVRF